MQIALYDDAEGEELTWFMELSHCPGMGETLPDIHLWPRWGVEVLRVTTVKEQEYGMPL